MDCIQATLQVGLRCEGNKNYSKVFSQFFADEHVLLARLVPRCLDPSIVVRQISMDCIQATLQVGLRCEGK